MRMIAAFCIGIAMTASTSTLFAQGSAPKDDSVTREEYESLKRELEELRNSLDMHPSNSQKEAIEATDQDSTHSNSDLLETQARVSELERLTESLRPGESGLHFSGFGFTMFANREGQDSSFKAAVVPVILWEPTDRLFFEAEIEFGLDSVGGEGETEVELEYAHGSFLVNDYITIGAGKFLTPFGLFAERLHPAWINKLPNAPLVSGHGGITPFSSVGAYVRGGFPIASTKVNYALYISNGPALNTGDDEPGKAGVLEFENFSDINNNKAIGGRIGILPIPEIEIGGSFLTGRVNPSGSGVGDADALIFGIDVSYVNEIKPIGGTLDLRFEYIHSEVDTVTFDPGGMGTLLRFDNERQGLYIQTAYRPTRHPVEFIRKFEVVGRYDYLDLPNGAPESETREQLTFGLNYWMTPSAVLKLAYELTDIEGQDRRDGFLMMFAIGF